MPKTNAPPMTAPGELVSATPASRRRPGRDRAPAGRPARDGRRCVRRTSVRRSTPRAARAGQPLRPRVAAVTASGRKVTSTPRPPWQPAKIAAGRRIARLRRPARTPAPLSRPETDDRARGRQARHRHQRQQGGDRGHHEHRGEAPGAAIQTPAGSASSPGTPPTRPTRARPSPRRSAGMRDASPRRRPSR